MTRCLLTAAAIGTLTGLALLFGPHGAIGVAVCAAGVLAWGCGRAVLRDERRERDKAYHPSSLCLNHCGDYYCVLGIGHDGPHRAMRNNPENYPNCVWGGGDGVRV